MVKVISMWKQDENMMYKFESSDGFFTFVLSAYKSKKTGKYEANHFSPHDKVLGKSLGPDAIKSMGLSEDYRQAYAKVKGELNGVKPKNVATASQETLFALSEIKSIKTASPLAQQKSEDNIPTQLFV